MLFAALAIPIKASAASASPTAGIVSVTNGKLNVRSKADSASTIVSKLDKGSYVSLHSKSGSWWYVEYGKNQFGYCHSAYISPAGGSARKVYTSSGNLNVRNGPGTSYTLIDSISKGESLIVLSSSGYWSKVLYHGTKTGYVYNIYLGPVGGYSSSSPVNLNVPSYKQYDSRWANIKIGSYGKTMSQIGCATTGLAMMESYRTGTIVTPADMRYRLSYTASGSVYWPSNYTSVNDSAAYLSSINNLLKSGKPVLLGLKNSYGSQHWVVVKGYNGTGLTASNFSINDPGSESRTNLQQILNTYPIFYKYFYY